MPHALGNQCSVSYAAANAIAVALIVDGMANGYLLVFHSCEAFPVQRRQFAQGFVRTPWRCPGCDDVLDSEGELRYALECETPDAIDVR